MFEVEEALEGSLRAGKSHGGREDVWLDLRLTERTVFKLQRKLEGLAADSKNWFEIRAVVLLSEDVRRAVIDYQREQGLREQALNLAVDAGGHPREA